jgi:hypothetical protein
MSKNLPATVRNAVWNIFIGTDTINNLRPICKLCNNSMGTKNMIEFMNTYGFIQQNNWNCIMVHTPIIIDQSLNSDCETNDSDHHESENNNSECKVY